MHKLCVRADCLNHLIHSYALVPADRLDSVIVTGRYLVHNVNLYRIIAYKRGYNIELLFKPCADLIYRYAVNIPVCTANHRQKIVAPVFNSRSCFPVYAMRSDVYVIIHAPVHKVGISLCRPVVLLKLARLYRSDQGVYAKILKTLKPLLSVKSRIGFVEVSVFKCAVPYHRPPVKFAPRHFGINGRALYRISVFVGYVDRHIVLAVLLDSFNRLLAPKRVLLHALVGCGNLRDLHSLRQTRI